MKYIYWISAAVILASGIGFSIYFGIQPKTIPKITYSHFEAPSDLAKAVILRLNQELKSSPIVLLGVMPGRSYDLEVWKAFLAESSLPGLQYQVLVVDPDLPGVVDMFPGAVRVNFMKDTDRFIEGAKKALSQGLRMAAIVPSIYGSQLLKESPASLIKQKSDLQPASFSLAGFPRNSEQEQKQELLCVMGVNDRQGTGALGCAVQNKARLVYRKKSNPQKFEGLMDLVGERDYLILFNAPEAKAL
ncbi:MAG: hypothetical protein IPM97_14775 [Bdellovibrionaceae bacterium]|nr:hypothetical protein [Pseudobdellovibrionaceae bacterium]